MLRRITRSGSTASIFELFRSEHCYLWEKKLVPHTPGTSINAVDPSFVQPVFSLPWGGTSLPVFYQNDPRVHSCSSYVGFYDNNVMQLVHGLGQKWDAEYKNLPREHQDAVIKQIVDSAIEQLAQLCRERGLLELPHGWGRSAVERPQLQVAG